MSICHPSWHDHALCRGLTPLFFPGQGETAEPAKALCRECPVRVECLTTAVVRVERFGVWGGKSERQRQRMRTGRVA